MDNILYILSIDCFSLPTIYQVLWLDVFGQIILLRWNRPCQTKAEEISCENVNKILKWISVPNNIVRPPRTNCPSSSSSPLRETKVLDRPHSQWWYYYNVPENDRVRNKRYHKLIKIFKLTTSTRTTDTIDGSRWDTLLLVGPINRRRRRLELNRRHCWLIIRSVKQQ